MMNMSRAGAAGFPTCARLISTHAGYNKAMKAHQPLLASWASAIVGVVRRHLVRTLKIDKPTYPYLCKLETFILK